LVGQVAIVTGAAKGLGEAITAVLAREGADVVFSGRDLQALEDHRAAIDRRYSGRRSLVVPCDVTEEEQVQKLVDRTVSEFDRIDILVNSAGVIGPIETPAQDVTAQDFRFVLDVNVVGTFLHCRAVIPHMIEQEYGRIINIAGTSGLRGYRNRVSYSSSKWAVRGLTRTLALELGPHNITVNDICPNVTNGPRMDKIVSEKARRTGRTFDEVYADFAQQTALGRFIDKEDVAETVGFLVSEGARNITGHDIVVDAGWDV
jgi:NAD(P)-dependent dehydrogenase (short-subunit alcohol dehydrogenase family)